MTHNDEIGWVVVMEITVNKSKLTNIHLGRNMSWSKKRFCFFFLISTFDLSTFRCNIDLLRSSNSFSVCAFLPIWFLWFLSSFFSPPLAEIFCFTRVSLPFWTHPADLSWFSWNVVTTDVIFKFLWPIILFVLVFPSVLLGDVISVLANKLQLVQVKSTQENIQEREQSLELIPINFPAPGWRYFLRMSHISVTSNTWRAQTTPRDPRDKTQVN